MGGGKPKQFLELSGRPILAHTLCALSQSALIDDFFVVVPEDFIPSAREIVSNRNWYTGEVPVRILPGGAERQNSVHNALLRLPAECDLVMIHDGVRPFASARLIRAVLEGARETGASIAAVPATDTVKRALGGKVAETLSREEIWLVQTPQVFRKDIILGAYEKAVASGWIGTDDASFVERIGIPVSVVQGERTNIKVTAPEDLEWARWFLSNRTGEGTL